MKIKNNEIPKGWSLEFADFVNKLLEKNEENRLGYKGINELKQHLWLKYYPWNLIKNKALPSPFIPSDSGNFDDKYCKGEDYIGEETKIRYVEILSKVNYDNCFKDFYYSIDGDNKRKNEMLLLSNKKEENNEINKSININKDNNIRKNENKK